MNIIKGSIFFFLLAWISLFAVSCSKSAQKLETASHLVMERPDSAYVILRDIDYYSLDSDSLRAKYILTRAIANTRVGRSLITDTLLNNAASYYFSVGDTTNWVLSSQLIADYEYSRGNADGAIEQLKLIKSNIKHPELLWDTYINLLKMSLNNQAYSDAYEYADWLLNHTDKADQKLTYYTAKAASQYMQGNHRRAVEIMDSVISTGLPESVEKSVSDEFFLEYAEMLNNNGQSQKAIDILLSIYPDDSKLNDEDKLYKKLSYALYLANLGETRKANEVIDGINHTATKEYFEMYSSIAMLKAALQYKETGKLPTELMHEVSKNIDFNHRLAQYDRQTAMESVLELSEDNYNLTLQRQRLLLILSGIIIALLITGIFTYILLTRRKQKIIEAEERAETLQQMLKESRVAENNTEDTVGTTRLKSTLLSHIGIFKTFAASPSQQSKEALKKISNIGKNGNVSDSLVNWTDFFSLIDNLYEGFYSKLIKLYPETFNDKELQIIVLLKADFSTKEISVLTEQSSATIYTRKSVIRKKLGVPENGDIINLIDEKFVSV